MAELGSSELGASARPSVRTVGPLPSLQVAALNIHLANRWKRQQFLKVVCGIDGKSTAGLDVCGVVESWLRDSNDIMNLELRDSQWDWFGKDRKRTRGGGLGLLVKKSLSPKLLYSASDNVLWVEIGKQEKWVIGIVYMIPGERSGVNLSTLDCLEVEVQQWRAEHNRILVLGDFNARVGELPNIVCDPDGEEERLLCVPRTCGYESRFVWSEGNE